MNTSSIAQRIFSKKVLMAWLPFAFLATTACGFAYVGIQQNYRLNANDPQVQIATDFKSFLEAGQPIPIPNASNVVELPESLAPFVMFFNASSTMVASTGQIGQDVPIPPSGVFDYVKAHGEERFTWEPRAGIRLAAVMVSYNGPKTSGFIVAARSLREVEIRENNLTLMAFVAWVVSLVGTLVLCAFAAAVSPNTNV